jgi:hypothetical protein
MSDFADRFNEDMERFLKKAQEWWTEFTDGKREHTFQELPKMTPERIAECNRKVAVAVARWEERKKESENRPPAQPLAPRGR